MGLQANQPVVVKTGSNLETLSDALCAVSGMEAVGCWGKVPDSGRKLEFQPKALQVLYHLFGRTPDRLRTQVDEWHGEPPFRDQWKATHFSE